MEQTCLHNAGLGIRHTFGHLAHMVSPPPEQKSFNIKNSETNIIKTLHGVLSIPIILQNI